MAKAKKKPKASAPSKRVAVAKAKPKNAKPIAATKKSVRAGKELKAKPSKPVKPAKAASEKKAAAPAKPAELRKPTLPGTLKLVPKTRAAAEPAREAAKPADPVPSGIFRLVPKPVEAAKAPAKTLRLVESEESSETGGAGTRAARNIKAALEKKESAKPAEAPPRQDPAELDKLLRSAIASKRLVRLTFNNVSRVVEPHDYGLRKGVAILFAYQLRHDTAQIAPEAVEGWRWFNVTKIADLTVLKEGFSGSRGEQHPRHNEWDTVFARVG
jgi:hypothetical protein